MVVVSHLFLQNFREAVTHFELLPPVLELTFPDSPFCAFSISIIILCLQSNIVITLGTIISHYFFKGVKQRSECGKINFFIMFKDIL